MGLVIRKIKMQTWLMAGVMLALGGLLFEIVAKGREMRAGLDLSQSSSIQVILGIGPYGWLGLAMVAGVSLILNDLSDRQTFWRKNLGAILLFQFSCAVMAVAWLLFSVLIQAGGITEAIH